MQHEDKLIDIRTCDPLQSCVCRDSFLLDAGVNRSHNTRRGTPGFFQSPARTAIENVAGVLGQSVSYTGAAQRGASSWLGFLL